MVVSRDFSLNVNDFAVVDLHFYKTAKAHGDGALQLVVNKILLVQVKVAKQQINVV